MRCPNFPRTALLAALVTIVIMAVPGAAGGQPAQQQQPTPQRQRPDQPALPVIDLSFPGGRVSEYVAAIRRAAGDANIVVDPEAAEIPMPPVALRHVTVPAALELLEGRMVSDGRVTIQLDVAHVPSFNPEERPTYQVQARTMGGPRQGPGAPLTRTTKVWTVSRLLGGDLTSRKLLSAVETALEVVGSETKPDVRFHEDTGLVIARGNSEQIEAIGDVIDQLSRSLNEHQQDQIARLKDMLDECRKRQMLPGARPAPDAEEPNPGEQRPGGN